MIRSGVICAGPASASKKSVLASEQDRPDVARRRVRWQRYQGQIDPQRLVFIDESEPLKAPLVRAQWRTTKTNMAPLRGWGRRGDRVKAKTPFGHWNTMTFLAALRHDRIDAPWVFDGPINAEIFRTYVEKVLSQPCIPATSSSWTTSAATRPPRSAPPSAPQEQGSGSCPPTART